MCPCSPCPNTSTATGPDSETWPLSYSYSCPSGLVVPVVSLDASATQRTQFVTLVSQDQTAEACDPATL